MKIIICFFVLIDALLTIKALELYRRDPVIDRLLVSLAYKAFLGNMSFVISGMALLPAHGS